MNPTSLSISPPRTVPPSGPLPVLLARAGRRNRRHTHAHPGCRSKHRSFLLPLAALDRNGQASRRRVRPVEEAVSPLAQTPPARPTGLAGGVAAVLAGAGGGGAAEGAGEGTALDPKRASLSFPVTVDGVAGAEREEGAHDRDLRAGGEEEGALRWHTE